MASEIENSKQKKTDGVGPLFHRIYSVKFEASHAEAQKVMEALKKDINAFSPQLIAKFEKIKGGHQSLKPGDEYEVKIPGPWKAPVRVSEVKESEIRLITLCGHLEAGEVAFRLKEVSDYEMQFEIESEARSKDAVVDFFYDKLGLAKLAQSEMWKSFCKNFAEQAAPHALTGQQKIEEVKIVTERQDEDTKQWTQI